MPTLISDLSLDELTARYAFIQKEASGEMQYLNKKADNPLEMNWVSFYDLEKNVDHMDWEQESSIRALMSNKCLYRITQKDGKKEVKIPTDYIANTIMAQMAKFEYARVMTHCGTKGNGKLIHTPCSKWKYCERCANTKRQFTFVRYNHVYSTTIDPCYFITLTLENKVEFVDGKREQVIRDWDRMNNYINTMVSHGLIKGAYIVEEASFDSYYPVPIINPHIHLVCVGKDGLKSHKFEDIKIDVVEIQNDAHWVTKVNYCHKAINFFKNYAKEWAPENAEVINRNFRDMLENHKELCKNRNQSRAVGILHAKNKGSIVKSAREIRDTYSKANIEKKKKRAGQNKEKKIKYNDMFEEFSQGAQTHLKEKLAVVQAAEKKPWYKNPWILAGGGLALGAGTYGAGKLYNNGNNIINDTFGKGVDNYIVNPIKGLFDKPQVPPVKQEPLQPFRTPAQSTLLPEKQTDNSFYDLAAKLGKKPEYVGAFPNVQGISPLRPELQANGLSLVSNPQQDNFIASVAKAYDTKANMVDTLTEARSSLLGDRAQNMIPGYEDKTPAEIATTISGWERQKQDLDKALSYDNLKNLKGDIPAHNQVDVPNIVRNLTSNSKDDNVRDLLNIATVPAAGYEIANMAPGISGRVAAPISNALLGKGMTSTLAKANPFLSPIVGMIPDAATGYNLAADAVEDPTGLTYKTLNSLGVKEENMPAVGGGLLAASTGGINAVSTPMTRAAVGKLIQRAGMRGLATAAGTAELSPIISWPAAITSTVASPVADMVNNNTTADLINHMKFSNRYSTVYQQLLEAKDKLDQGDALAVKGLMQSLAFRNIDITDPETVNNLYEAIGPRPANVLMTAKKEGVMGLIGRKLLDIMNNNKYAPSVGN